MLGCSALLGGKTYAMSPAVEGEPYSSKRRMRSPNCPCKSPNILTGAFIWRTLGSLENIRSALSQRSAISLQSRKNCRRTGGFQPRGFRRCAITWKILICQDYHWPNKTRLGEKLHNSKLDNNKEIKCCTVIQIT